MPHVITLMAATTTTSRASLNLLRRSPPKIPNAKFLLNLILAPPRSTSTTFLSLCPFSSPPSMSSAVAAAVSAVDSSVVSGDENLSSNPLLQDFDFPPFDSVDAKHVRPGIRALLQQLGAFELDCTVCPIAIKYNKIFVDAFWNSRKQSFTMHLLQLMTSWAVVCEVWYLEPQTIQPGETATEFAERVRDMISLRAGLKKVPWDGYLKYSRPSPKHSERKQQSFAESLIARLEEK